MLFPCVLNHIWNTILRYISGIVSWPKWIFFSIPGSNLLSNLHRIGKLPLYKFIYQLHIFLGSYIFQSELIVLQNCWITWVGALKSLVGCGGGGSFFHLEPSFPESQSFSWCILRLSCKKGLFLYNKINSLAR